MGNRPCGRAWQTETDLVVEHDRWETDLVVQHDRLETDLDGRA